MAALGMGEPQERLLVLPSMGSGWEEDTEQGVPRMECAQCPVAWRGQECCMIIIPATQRCHSSPRRQQLKARETGESWRVCLAV